MNGSSYRDLPEPPDRRMTGIVTASLVWYDEPPELLAECVAGAGKIADRIVAVDGAYARYPGAKITSPPEQAVAIRRAAKRAKLDCLVLTPDRLWAGQVEKRSYALAAAAVGSDWIAVVDADHVIDTDRAEARSALASLPATVACVSVIMMTPPDPARPLEQTSATGWHRGMASTEMRYDHLFRTLPGLRLERFHWWYSAIRDGERVWISQGEATSGPVTPLPARYVVEHRCHTRDEGRMLAGRAFCNDRVKVVEQTGQEDDLPTLPRPVFDYQTVPY